jgi:uncharacterized protein (UPF0262 family)
MLMEYCFISDYKSIFGFLCSTSLKRPIYRSIIDGFFQSLKNETKQHIKNSEKKRNEKKNQGSKTKRNKKKSRVKKRDETK